MRYKVSNSNSHKMKESFNILKDLLLPVRDYLEIETLVLFSNHQQIKEMDPEFFNLELNKIIITQPMTWRIRDSFKGTILSLVYLETMRFDQELFELISNALSRWHLKKIVFISQNSILEFCQESKDLLEWLHKEGFWSSFLMDSQGNTLAMEHFSHTFYGNTLSLQEFLLSNIFWKDLKGYPIHVAIANNPPRALLYRREKTQVILKGYYGSIISIFSNVYNASLVTHEISDFLYYSELDCLEAIQEDNMDICADSIAWNLHDVVTTPEELAASYLVVPYDKPLPRFQYFFKPFQTSLWLLVFISLIYIIITLSVIHRIQHNSWQITFHLEYAVLALINLPFELRKVKGFRRKYLELLLMFKGFIVSNWYLSILTSLLFARLYSRDINSVEDLQRLNVTIMVSKCEYTLLNTSNIDPIILKQLMIVPNHILHENRRNLYPKYAYFSQYDTNNFYLYQQKFLLRPRMRELREVPVLTLLAGTAMRANWPFEHLLNNLYGLLMETGLCQHLLSVVNEDGIRLGYLKYFPTEYNFVEPLSLEYIQLPALILAGGYLMGFISFVMECLYLKKKYFK
ncbi:uncharacterized protein ACRADG_008859 [Cochliomyia hominivorax]